VRTPSTPPPQVQSTHGTTLGRSFVWDGTLRGRGSATPDLYTGKGAPTATNPVPNPKPGSLYWRVDGGGAGFTHLYYFNAGAWLGIA
jgi:hypothetical protein